MILGNKQRYKEQRLGLTNSVRPERKRAALESKDEWNLLIPAAVSIQHGWKQQQNPFILRLQRCALTLRTNGFCCCFQPSKFWIPAFAGMTAE